MQQVLSLVFMQVEKKLSRHNINGEDESSQPQSERSGLTHRIYTQTAKSTLVLVSALVFFLGWRKVLDKKVEP